MRDTMTSELKTEATTRIGSSALLGGGRGQSIVGTSPGISTWQKKLALKMSKEKAEHELMEIMLTYKPAKIQPA
jgi:hypothetical protein